MIFRRLLKYCFTLICLGLLFCIYSLGKTFIYNDITVEPIYKPLNSDISNGKHITQLPVYLASYADGGDIWHKNQNALTLSALNKGIDIIINYKRHHLSTEFLRKNKYIMSQSSGGGYWLWKPYLILKTLQGMPENAILIYCDSANIFTKPITNFLLHLKDHDIILCEYDASVYGKLERVVKREALIKTKCDTLSCRQSPHFLAGFIALRNTKQARAFIQKWLQYCEQPDLIMGDRSPQIQYSDFSHHQHDEALLCITYAQQNAGIKALPHKEYNFVKMLTRKPGKEYVSSYEWMNKGMHGIDKKILNSSIMQKLRQLILEKH